MKIICLLAILVLVSATQFTFLEDFDHSNEKAEWVNSKNERYGGDGKIGTPTKFPVEFGGDSMILKQSHRFYGIAKKFDSIFDVTDEDFVIQYEVQLQNGLECGGAYLKILSAETMPEPEDLEESTPFTIMFGPDKCGETNKVHFIFRHQNPINGEWEEKHLINPPTIRADTLSHLYSLIVRVDNTYEIKIDNKTVKEGSLLEDFTPAVNPSEEIDDPEDFKPEDWVDEAEIKDPEASKPEDWDEDAPQFIPDMEAGVPEGWLEDEEYMIEDPDAIVPEDWDEEEDGEWESMMVDNPLCLDAPGCGEWTRPMMRNPEFKGKWIHPKIANPDYIGEWTPEKIPNPNYFLDLEPHNMAAIGGVAIEVWTTVGDIAFDNILLTTDVDYANTIANEKWLKKFNAQSSVQSEARKTAEMDRRTEKWLNGGFMAKLEVILATGADYVTDYPNISVAFGVIVMAACLICCCGPLMRKKKPATNPEDAESVEETDDEEVSEVSDEEEESKSAEEEEEDIEGSQDEEEEEKPKRRRARAD